MTYEIRCADCGSPRTTLRRNTRYCRVCRLGRDFKFLGRRKEKCWDCSKHFAPLHANDVLCADCDDNLRDCGSVVCAVCEEEGRRLEPDLELCVPCAKDPAKRPALTRSLRTKSRERAVQNGVTT